MSLDDLGEENDAHVYQQPVETRRFINLPGCLSKFSSSRTKNLAFSFPSVD